MSIKKILEISLQQGWSDLNLLSHLLTCLEANPHMVELVVSHLEDVQDIENSKPATFVTIWEGGLEFKYPAMVNKETGLVTPLQIVDGEGLPEEAQILERYCVICEDVEYVADGWENRDKYSEEEQEDMFFFK